MKNNQSRPGSTLLVGMVIAASVGLGVVGCAEHPTTPSASSMSGETSTAASAQNMVDVSAVWVTHPMPPCPRVVVGNESAPVGLELPDDETVARQLAGVRSPGSPQWVRTKLGWVTQWLSKTRADLIAFSDTAGEGATIKRFDQYVAHVKSELQSGHDISDSSLDGRFPEGCI